MALSTVPALKALAANKMLHDLPKIMQLLISMEVESSDLLPIRRQEGFGRRQIHQKCLFLGFMVGRVQSNTTPSLLLGMLSH